VIFKEQAPWFTIAHAVQLKPVRKEVIDFKLSPFGRHSFYGVDMTNDAPVFHPPLDACDLCREPF
jgi:dipeptide transport system substrate-binding protein